MAEATVKKGEIELNSVSYCYPKSTDYNLKEISVRIVPGEFVAIMGHTGAGKTTFQMLLNGLIPHFFRGTFTGTAISNGLNTTKFHIHTLARFAGFVMQDPETQIFGVTVQKDVAFGPSNLGLSRQEINQRIDKALAAVRLSGYEERSSTNLSGGEKQRLAIAGILAMEPDILVLDEPTSELDPVGKKEIFQTLSALQKNKQLTILIASHDSEEILEFVDRVLVLSAGKIVWDGNPKDLFREAELVIKLGLKLPEVAEFGFALYQNNIIEKSDIPLKITDAQNLTQKLVGTLKIDKSNFSQRNRTEKKQEIIHVRNLVYQYVSGENVLKEINLTLYKGELIAIVGQNGAGKTTLVKHFNGLLKPTRGNVFIDGIDTRKTDVSELAKKVGYVFQNPDHQIFCATVEKEIEFGLLKFNFPLKEREQRIKNSLEFVGLTDSRNRHPFTLGKGERQKLAVATVLAMSPEILIIDEPTTGQDWAGTERMMDMIAELNQQGHTIIIITHNMRLAAQLADRVIVMHNGTVLLDDVPEKIFYQREKLNAAYLQPPQTTELAQALRPLGMPSSITNIDALISIIISTIKGPHN